MNSFNNILSTKWQNNGSQYEQVCIWFYPEAIFLKYVSSQNNKMSHQSSKLYISNFIIVTSSDF